MGLECIEIDRGVFRPRRHTRHVRASAPTFRWNGAKSLRGRVVATAWSTLTTRHGARGRRGMTKPRLLAGAGLRRRVRRPVRSVGPDEPVQQRVRVSGRSLVDDGDEGNLEDGVGEVGVPGEAGETGPDARNPSGTRRSRPIHRGCLVDRWSRCRSRRRPCRGSRGSRCGGRGSGRQLRTRRSWRSGPRCGRWWCSFSDLLVVGWVGCSGQAGYRPPPLGASEVHGAPHHGHGLPGSAAGQAVEHDVGGFQPTLDAPQADAGEPGQAPRR